MKVITIKKAIADIPNVKKGESKYFNKTTSFGFFDWFCKDTSLEKRAINLLVKLNRIHTSKKLQFGDGVDVCFKNCCPMCGNTYDEIIISDIKGNCCVIVPRSGHKSDNGNGEVFLRNDCDQLDITFTGTWTEIVKWFNSDI